MGESPEREPTAIRARPEPWAQAGDPGLSVYGAPPADAPFPECRATRTRTRLGRAFIASRNRTNGQGHTAGSPRSSRYQLRQPVTHTVCCAALLARALELGQRVVRRAHLAALAGPDALDELHDVAELELGDLDE